MTGTRDSRTAATTCPSVSTGGSFWEGVRTHQPHAPSLPEPLNSHTPPSPSPPPPTLPRIPTSPLPSSPATLNLPLVLSTLPVVARAPSPNPTSQPLNHPRWDPSFPPGPSPGRRGPSASPLPAPQQPRAPRGTRSDCPAPAPRSVRHFRPPVPRLPHLGRLRGVLLRALPARRPALPAHRHAGALSHPGACESRAGVGTDLLGR